MTQANEDMMPDGAPVNTGAEDLEPDMGGGSREPEYQHPPGDYDAFMGHIKLLANPVVASVSEMMTFGNPTKAEKEYIMRMLPLGIHELNANAGWWEVALDEMMPRRRLLQKAIADWESVDERLLDQLPLTPEECAVELSQLDRRVRALHRKINNAKLSGHYWSVKPLLAFFSQPQEDRIGFPFDHLLPPMLQLTVLAIYSTFPAGVGFANRQAIGAQTVLDMFQQSNFAPRDGGKRQRLPRLRPPAPGGA